MSDNDKESEVPAYLDDPESYKAVQERFSEKVKGFEGIRPLVGNDSYPRDHLVPLTEGPIAEYAKEFAKEARQLYWGEDPEHELTEDEKAALESFKATADRQKEYLDKQRKAVPLNGEYWKRPLAVMVLHNGQTLITMNAAEAAKAKQLDPYELSLTAIKEVKLLYDPSFFSPSFTEGELSMVFTPHVHSTVKKKPMWEPMIACLRHHFPDRPYSEILEMARETWEATYNEEWGADWGLVDENPNKE